MRNRKHWSTLLWAAAFMAYAILGIGLISTVGEGGEENDARTELVLAVPSGVTLTPIYRNAVAEFEKLNPDIRVKLLETSGKFYQKVTVMIAGGDPPDLMWMGQSFAEFADRDVFLDITDRIRKEVDLSLYPAEILALYRRNGRFYGLPYGIDASFVIYNRKLFREAGLRDPEDDWTFDEFLSVARRLVKRDAEGRTVRFAINQGLSYDVFGARVFDPETGRADCDTPEMVNYFRTNLRLMNEERLVPNAVDKSELGSDILGMFKQEKVAMLQCTTMRQDRMYDVFAGMDWGVTLLPKVKCQAQWASSQAICISRETRHPEEAWRLCRFFQGRAFQMAMARRCFPANKVYAAEYIDSRGDQPCNFKVMHKVLRLLTPMPRVPNLQELSAVFDRFSADVLLGTMTPEEAMRQCAAEINRRRAKILEHKKTAGVSDHE